MRLVEWNLTLRLWGTRRLMLFYTAAPLVAFMTERHHGWWRFELVVYRMPV